MKIQGYFDPKKNTKTTVIEIPIEVKGGELGLNPVIEIPIEVKGGELGLNPVIQIQIEVKGGELGLNPVKNLVSMVDGLKNVKSESEYEMCCKDCAFYDR